MGARSRAGAKVVWVSEPGDRPWLVGRWVPECPAALSTQMFELLERVWGLCGGDHRGRSGSVSLWLEKGHDSVSGAANPVDRSDFGRLAAADGVTWRPRPAVGGGSADSCSS